LHVRDIRATILCTDVDRGEDVSTEDLEQTFWFCIKHHAVERFAGCGSNNRIGPFKSSDDAQNALKTIADRESRYDAEDAAWEGDD
jgi:hypothetical protein